MTKTPLVEVLMPTYNHAKFVAEAIESVLAQETDFAYRLLIADDCSADGTQDILKSYAAKYPDLISLILSPRHVGIIDKERVSFKALDQCTAKYVALLEGDDYWTDPAKLQKQVNFLESHPECAVAFHNARMSFEDEPEASRNMCPENQKQFSTLEDIIKGNFIPTCSVMFRSGLFGKVPGWMYTLPIGDWPMHILNAEHGDIGYIDEVMAVYRVHRKGLWSMRSRLSCLEGEVQICDALRKHLGREHRGMIDAALLGRLMTLADDYDSGGETAKARAYLSRYVFESLRRGHRPEKYIFLTLLRLRAPAVFKSARGLKRALMGVGRKS